MKVVFICGPYRGSTAWEIEQNVRVAEEASLEAMRVGAFPYCPHTASRFFEGILPDAFFLKGCLEMLGRCDAILTVGEWRGSSGAVNEVDFARENGIRYFGSVEALKAWLEAVEPF